MYCKYLSQGKSTSVLPVLIVAKCIVNVIVSLSVFKNTFVLIVAKCIVNFFIIFIFPFSISVLIVAKCIVNFGILTNAQVTAKY